MADKNNLENKIISGINLGILGAGGYFTYKKIKDNQNVKDAFQEVKNASGASNTTATETASSTKLINESVTKSEDILNTQIVREFKLINTQRDVTRRLFEAPKSIISPYSFINEYNELKQSLPGLTDKQIISFASDYYKQNTKILKNIIKTFELDENLNPNLKSYLKTYYNTISKYTEKSAELLKTPPASFNEFKEMIRPVMSEMETELEPITDKILSQLQNENVYSFELQRRLNVALGKMQSSVKSSVKNLMYKRLIVSGKFGDLQSVNEKELENILNTSNKILFKPVSGKKIQSSLKILENNLSNIGFSFEPIKFGKKEVGYKLKFGTSGGALIKEVSLYKPDERGFIYFNKALYKQLSPIQINWDKSGAIYLKSTTFEDVLVERLSRVNNTLRSYENLSNRFITEELATEAQKTINQFKLYLGVTPGQLSPQKFIQTNQIKLVTAAGKIEEGFRILNDIDKSKNIFKGYIPSEAYGLVSGTPSSLKSGNILSPKLVRKYQGIFTIDIHNNINAMKIFRDTMILDKAYKPDLAGMTVPKFIIENEPIYKNILAYNTMVINPKKKLIHLEGKSLDDTIKELYEKIKKSPLRAEEKKNAINQLFKLVALEPDQAVLTESSLRTIGQEVIFENVDITNTVIAKKGDEYLIPKGSTIFFESGHKKVADYDIFIKGSEELKSLSKDKKALKVVKKLIGEIRTNNIEKLFGQHGIKVMVSDIVSDAQNKLIYSIYKNDEEVTPIVKELLSKEQITQEDLSKLNEVLNKKSKVADLFITPKSVRKGERSISLMFDYLGQKMKEAGLQDEFIEAAKKAGINMTYNPETESYVINKLDKSETLLVDAYKKTMSMLNERFKLDKPYKEGSLEYTKKYYDDYIKAKEKLHNVLNEIKAEKDSIWEHIVKAKEKRFQLQNEYFNLKREYNYTSKEIKRLSKKAYDITGVSIEDNIEEQIEYYKNNFPDLYEESKSIFDEMLNLKQQYPILKYEIQTNRDQYNIIKEKLKKLHEKIKSIKYDDERMAKIKYYEKETQEKLDILRQQRDKYYKVRPKFNKIIDVLEEKTFEGSEDLKTASWAFEGRIFKNIYGPFMQSQLKGDKASFNRDVFANLVLKSRLLGSEGNIYDAFLNVLQEHTVISTKEARGLHFLNQWLRKDLKIPSKQIAKVVADTNKIIINGKALELETGEVASILTNLTSSDSKKVVSAANRLQNILAQESELYREGFNIVKVETAGEIRELPLIGRTMNHMKSYLEEVIALEPEIKGAKDTISILSKFESALSQYTKTVFGISVDKTIKAKKIAELRDQMSYYMSQMMSSDNNIIKLALTARPLNSAQLTAELRSNLYTTRINKLTNIIRDELLVSPKTARKLAEEKVLLVHPKTFQKMLSGGSSKLSSNEMAIGLLQSYPSTGMGNTQAFIFVADKEIQEGKVATMKQKVYDAMMSDSDGDELHGVLAGKLKDFGVESKQAIKDSILLDHIMSDKFYHETNKIVSEALRKNATDVASRMSDKEKAIRQIVNFTQQKEFEKSVVGPVTNLTNAFKSIMLLDKGGVAFEDAMSNQMMLMLLESVIKAKKTLGEDQDAVAFVKNINELNKYINSLLTPKGTGEELDEIEKKLSNTLKDILTDINLTDASVGKNFKAAATDMFKELHENGVIETELFNNLKQELETSEASEIFESMAKKLSNRFVKVLKKDKRQLADLIHAFSKNPDISNIISLTEEILAPTSGTTNKEVLKKLNALTETAERETVNGIAKPILNYLGEVYKAASGPIKFTIGALAASGVLYGMMKGRSQDDYEMPIAAKSAAEIDPSLAPNMKTIHVGNPTFDVRLDSIINEVHSKDTIVKFINGLTGANNVKVTLYDRTQSDRYI